MNVLSDHPRWMFKKNLIKFFIGLDFYLYYFYSGCTLSPWSHVLLECSVITWLCYVTLVPTLFISQPYCISWGFGLNVWMLGKLFSFWDSYNMASSSSFLILRNFSIDSSSRPISFLFLFHTSFFSIYISILP